MPRPAELAGNDFPERLHKHLLENENPEKAIALQRHWLTVAEPVASAVLGLILLLWASVAAPSHDNPIFTVLMVIEIAAILRAAFYLWRRRREWWIITNKRLINIRGVLTVQKSSIPAKKLNDMTVTQTLLGQIFKYGDFVVDSAHAGKDPLGKLDMIEYPDEYYKYIMNVILSDDAPSKPAAPAPRTPPQGIYSGDLSAAQEDDPTTRFATPPGQSTLDQIHSHVGQGEPAQTLLGRVMGFLRPSGESYTPGSLATPERHSHLHDANASGVVSDEVNSKYHAQHGVQQKSVPSYGSPHQGGDKPTLRERAFGGGAGRSDSITDSSDDDPSVYRSR